jgi:hypothetical protein
MPSLLIAGAVSGGSKLYASGDPFSGMGSIPNGIELKLRWSGVGPVYIGLPPPVSISGPGPWSGSVTILSGGALNSGFGSLTDGREIYPGESIFVPRSRLTSGLESILVAAPAASSGVTLFWDWQ